MGAAGCLSVMFKIFRKLKNGRQIENAKPAGTEKETKLFDGGGRYLEVAPPATYFLSGIFKPNRLILALSSSSLTVMVKPFKSMRSPATAMSPKC